MREVEARLHAAGPGTIEAELVAVARHGGNVKTAAKAAGVNTVTLYRLLKRRGLHLGRTVRVSDS